MEGLQPTFDISGNNNCGNWGGTAIAAAVGGAIGAAWNGNRWNNGNCGNGCGCNNSGQYVMDTLTTMRTDINSIGRDNLMQTAALQATNCQGFGGVHSAVERVGAQLAQAQSRTEAAVYTTGLQGQIQDKDNTIFNLNAAHRAEVQGMRNTFDLLSAQKDCCCTTQRSIDAVAREVERQGCESRAAQKDCCCTLEKAIHHEGEATRALVASLDRENKMVQIADLKAENALLRNQGYTAGLVANAAQQTRNDVQGALTTIIGHMAAFRQQDTTGGGTAAAA